MYKITCLQGGKTYTLYDPLSDDLMVFNDQLDTEKNAPGELKFEVAYNHPYLQHIIGLSSDIRVYDGADEIWRGRPIDDGVDLLRTRSFKCEGELAFLYDSIQPRRELHSISPLEFFTLLINEHNSQVRNRGPIDKTFQIGIVTVTDSNNSIYRYTNRETTFDCIKEKLLDRLGGYLRIRVQDGVRYLDWLSTLDTVSDQPIQLGDNLLDYSQDTDYTQVATACIPLGEHLEETEIDALDAYLTIESVNNGSDTIQISSAVERFGFICKVLHFDDITVPANLKTAGEKWLTDGQYAQMTMKLTAVDLHGLGYNIQPIRINSRVRVISVPHGMNRYFDVSKRSYHISQPDTDTVVIGSNVKQTYTSSSNKQVTAVQHKAEETRRHIDTVIAAERENVSNILNQATHGYVVLDPNSGPERILIMDTNSVSTAQKIWKWDMNGLGYSSKGINGPWGVAITMNGEISADYILTGELDASLIKVGKIQDVTGNNFWDMETGEFQLAATTKVGSSTIAKASDLDNFVVSTDVEYGNSNSASTVPSTWTTNASWAQGKFLWTRTKMTLEDGTIQYSDARLIANGNGIGLSKVTEQYYLSTSNTTQTGGSWMDTQPTWVKGRYYWTRSRIEWADGTTTYSDPVLAQALTSGNQSTDNLDDSLNQQGVFNRLTNNGQIQGIFMNGGQLYINASYIATGILSDAGSNTVFNLNTGTLTMNKGSINIGNGIFQVTTGGALTATSANISGTIFAGDPSGVWMRMNTSGQLCGGIGATQFGYIDYSSQSSNPDNPNSPHRGIQIQGGVLRISTNRIAVSNSSNVNANATIGGTGSVRVVLGIEKDSDGHVTSISYGNIAFVNGINVNYL